MLHRHPLGNFAAFLGQVLSTVVGATFAGSIGFSAFFRQFFPRI